MKPKFLDFPPSGIQCPVCGDQSNYIGCDKHGGFYPSLEKNDSIIRIPNCKDCFLECVTCKEDRKVTSFLELYEQALKVNLTRKVKRKRKTEAIKVISTVNDKVENLSNIKGIKELEFYRSSVFGSLELLFCFDVGSQFGIRDMEKKLEGLGIDIPVNLSPLRKINEKISVLLYTLLMIRATGLTTYEKQIMESEIYRLYKKSIPKKDIIEELLPLIRRKKIEPN